MFLLYHAYVYLEFLILACTIYILAPDGFGTGEKLEEDTYSNLKCGTLKGRTKIHFFDVNSLSKLLDECGFRNVKIDTIFYTDQGNKIELLIAKAEK